MRALEGKVALVTGAAHPEGMGYASGRKLAQAGARVVLTDRVADPAMREMLEARRMAILEEGGEALAMPMDVTDRGQIDACIEELTGRLGGVDILFNNAGSPVGCGEFLTMSDEQWDISYRVNLKGTADCSQAVLLGMVSRGRGVIINNASLAGISAVPEMAAYTATKFAVVGLTKALAAEFGPRGVRVNAICPGMIWTQMGRAEVEQFREPDESFEAAKHRLVKADLVPLERWGEADEVADAVVFLASDAASYINGVTLPVAGGMAPGL